MYILKKGSGMFSVIDENGIEIDRSEYGAGKKYSYNTISGISISIKPTKFTPGMISFMENGKEKNITFSNKDYEMAIEAVDFAKSKINGAATEIAKEFPDAKYILEGGVKDTLIVYEDRVIIRHKGIVNVLAMEGVSGDKTIYITDITSVQFKPANKILSGHIQFSLPGGNEARGGLLAAAGDENTVTFVYSVNDKAQEIQSYLNQRIREFKTGTISSSSTSSNADELRKYKSLLDDGIITQVEFDAKKKELLGL